MIENWVSTRSAVDRLKTAGIRLSSVHSHLAAALADGSLRAKARRLRSELPGELIERIDSEVVPAIWKFGHLPPFGHTFWRNGRAQFEILLPGTVAADMAPANGCFNPICPTVLLEEVHFEPVGWAMLLEDLGIPPIRAASTAKARRGRTPGAGSYEAQDMALLGKILNLIETGQAHTLKQAALAVAPRARGAGALESKAERLLRQLRKRRSVDN